MLARFVLVLLLASAFQAVAQDAERLRINGSNALGERLVPALVESWLRTSGYSGIHRQAIGARRLLIRATRDGAPLIVDIDKGGSASGMRALIDGKAELAMMARTPSARERDDGWQLGDLGSPDQEFVIALDGIAVVVNAANPLQRLDLAQLRTVMSGQLSDWNQLGGAAQAIHLHLGDRRSGAREFLQQRVMGADPLAPTARTHASMASLLAAVAADPAAIGIVNLRRPLPAGTRALAISDGGEAIAPGRVQVMSEDYPLTRRLSLYGGQMMTALGRSFALYTLTHGGQQAVAKAGHLAMTLRPSPRMPPPTVPAYADAVAHAQRLPLSLRFNYQSSFSIFDSRSERDLDRLAAFMRLPPNIGRGVVVVAFAGRDAGGSVMSTLASNDRADIVAERLQQLGIAVLRARGLGGVRPLQRVSEAGARFRNERVEVWLR